MLEQAGLTKTGRVSAHALFLGYCETFKIDGFAKVILERSSDGSYVVAFDVDHARALGVSLGRSIGNLVGRKTYFQSLNAARGYFTRLAKNPSQEAS